MTNSFSKNAEDPQENSSKNDSFSSALLIPILVSIIVAAITSLVTIHLQSVHERPNIKILGAMPIHVYGEISGVNIKKWPIHQLAFIFKIENKSPTSTIAHMALIDGCIPLDPLVADSHLPENQQIANGTNINLIIEKYKKTIQKISISAGISQNSKLISEYAISYIGTIFTFPKQGAFGIVPNSISLIGNCDEIEVSNPQPAFHQLLKIRSINEFPKVLCPEFYDGVLKLSLFVGNEKISIDPNKIINPIRSLRLKNWEELALPQMYENPETGYPPTINSK